MHFPSQRVFVRAWLSLALGAAGCSDSTSPSGGLVGIQAALADVDTVFAAPVVRSAGYFALGPLPLAAPPAGGPLLPDSLLGKTLAYACAARAYAISGDPGAPAAGVRLNLYRVQADGAIACPATALGAMDIFDAGAGDTVAVRVVAKGGDGQPYVEYTIRRAVADTLDLASAAGWVSDGQRRLAFTVMTGPASRFNAGSFTLQLDDSATALHGSLRDVWRMGVDTHSDSLDLTVSQSGTGVELAGSTSWANGISGWDERVTVNGEPFAAVDGTVAWGNGEPTVTSLRAAPLTDGERRLVRHLVEEPGDLSRSLRGVLGLGGRLVSIRF